MTDTIADDEPPDSHPIDFALLEVARLLLESTLERLEEEKMVCKGEEDASCVEEREPIEPTDLRNALTLPALD